MTKVTRHINTYDEQAQLEKYIHQMSPPYTVDIENGIKRKRSIAQNRLQRKWMLEAEAQDPNRQTAEEHRAFCKLHFGVPILRNEDDDFCKKYDEKVKPFPYEQKLEFMAEPWDFPVTRIMTTKQKTRFLNACYQYFVGERGFVLTEPDYD